MRLDLQKVTFKNFMSYGNVAQSIEFKEGLNLITGKDVGSGRSNGAGKSSALLTIPFALFGKTDKEIKKDQIVNWKNKKHCEVILSFKKNNDVYSVLRAIKPDKLEIYKNNVLVQPPSDVRMYQKVLENDILNTNMSFDMFMYLVYTNLNSSIPLLRMTTPQKRSFLEHMFGLELYTKVNELANEKLKNIQEKVFTLKVSVDQMTSTVSDLTKQNDGLRLKIVSTSSDEKKLDEKNKEFSEINQHDPTVKENLTVEIDELVKKLNKTTNDYRLLDNDIRDLEAENKNNTANIISINEQEKKRNDNLLFVNKEIENLTVDQDIIFLSVDNVGEINKKIEQLTNDRASIITNITVFTFELDDKKKTYKSLESGVCPTCHQSCSHDMLENGYVSIISELELKISDYKEKIKQFDILIKEYKDSISRNDKVIEKNQEKTNKLNILQSKRDVIQNMEIPSPTVFSEKIKENNIKLEALLDKKPVIENDIKNQEEIILVKKHNLISIQQTLDKIMTIKNEILAIENEIRTKKEMKLNIETLIKENDDKITELLSKTVKTKSSIDKLSTLSDYLNHLKLLCKDENVKQYAISSILPYFEQKVNFYLSESGSNHYLKFDKWLNVEISGPGIHSVGYNSLSSGEQRSIDLSNQFSFLDISKTRSDLFPDVLLLDEILDSSIDWTGIYNIMRIVKTKQAEDKNKVFIITHRTEISDVDVDNVYNVYKEDGFSRIEKID
jgi:DNA repair exonuclease SbcCD ATPase subunit